MLNQTQRLQMIEQALADKAPQTYLRLRCEGRLLAFLSKHEGEMMASFYRAYGEVYYRISRDYPDKGEAALALEAARDQEFQDALSRWTRFSDEEPVDLQPAPKARRDLSPEINSG